LKELVKKQQDIDARFPLDAFHHKDPFDRLLIAQRIEEGLTIVTADSQFSSYSVKLLQ
jgi:PIN domain nuclease of toxin-antitoxin system